MMFDGSNAPRAVAVCSAVLLLFSSGCERDSDAGAGQQRDAAPTTQNLTFEPPEPRPLLDGIEDVRDLELSEAHRYPECHEIFEPAGEVVERFPIPDPDERAMTLGGCEPEAYERWKNEQFIAYGTAEVEGSRVRDMRFLRFDESGKRVWEQTMSRRSQGGNFIANYRDSFIALLPTRLACAGTLWEGGTQTMCLDWETGEKKWDGRLPFWSGMAPVAHGDGLVVADLSAITRRYPFSGVEMAHRKLDGIGGRAGFYATDAENLYFAPGRAEQPRLVKYSFDGFNPLWRMKLPGNPTAGYHYVFDEEDLLVLKIDDVIYGIDTESADVRWAFDVEDDRPPIVMHGGQLMMLRRRPDDPNTLVVLDPRTGRRDWSAPTPAGTLRLQSMDDVLLLKSVRAVQRVENLEAPSAAANRPVGSDD